MKKRLFSLLISLCLAVVLLPTLAHGDYTLPAVNKKDTVKWSKLYDVETEKNISFQYEVPKNGAAVLIFYKTSCGNSQAAFTALNEQSWVKDDRINFYAVESTSHTIADIRAFRKEYASNITDAVTWLDSTNSGTAFDYLDAAGLDLDTLTFPVMVVCTEEAGVKTIRAIDIAVTDVRLLAHTLQELLKTDLGVPYPVPVTIAVTADYDMAAELAELTNQKRMENGLTALQYNKVLTEAAMTRAAEMALYPSYERPDGTSSYTIVDLYLPNNTTGYCFAGYACDTAEDFWMNFIDPVNFYRWYLSEYNESGADLVGAGCVLYNNMYYWAVAIAADSTQTEATDQSGQVARRYTINSYADYLNDPCISPAEITLYPGASATLYLTGGSFWTNSPLIPAACDSEIKDASGQVIATAAIAEDGSITVTAKAVGAGTLHVSAWPNQETPYTAAITVSEDVAYKPHGLHTTVKGSGRIALSAETATKDTWVEILCTPDEGYWLANLFVQDAEGNMPDWYLSSANGYTIRMPATDVYITAEFLSNDIPQTPFTVFTDTNSNGSLELFGNSRNYYASTTVTVIPTPQEGYILAVLTATDDYGNSIDITPNADGSYSFQMPASDVILRPIFAPKEGYTIIVADSYGCTVSPNSATALPGETVTVTITPDEGYELRDYSTNLWEDDSTLTDGNTLTFTMPDHDVELYVYCKPSPITAGTLGENTRWSYKDGTLTISGEGSMGKNENFSALPWYDYLSDIHTVVIEEGVTDIFYRAFSNIDGLTSITIPSTVDYIGEWAFLNDENLTKITFAGAAPSRGMESSVFSGVSAIVYVPANDRSWNDEVTRDYDGDLTWNHSWSERFFDANCTEDGYTLCTCICGDTHKGDILPAFGHEYEDGACKYCGVQDPDYKEPFKNPFTDVEESDWFYAPVLWAVENKVTGGMTETTFGPNANCTRAQVVTFLYAAAGKPEVKANAEPFDDVSEADWFYTPVLWAVENGITGGISATEFGPNQECTRAQVVTFLYAAAGKPLITAGSDFSDVADTDWYAKPVIWAKANNITGGISPTEFGPNNICTRAQVVTFLYKADQIK